LENAVSHAELNAGLLGQMLRKMLKVFFKGFFVFLSVLVELKLHGHFEVLSAEMGKTLLMLC
jgi:hypothetical protein